MSLDSSIGKTSKLSNKFHRGTVETIDDVARRYLPQFCYHNVIHLHGDIVARHGRFMPKRKTPIPQTKKGARAAILIAEDELSDAAIADDLGISRSTLSTWKLDPAFQAAVTAHLTEIEASMRRLSIAKKYRRVAALDDLHERALEVVMTRAKRYGDIVEKRTAATIQLRADPPLEAATGLLVRKETYNNKGIPSIEWSVDTGLMREIRALEEQAAKELGQFVDKADVTHNGGIEIREYVGIPEDTP